MSIATFERRSQGSIAWVLYEYIKQKGWQQSAILTSDDFRPLLGKLVDGKPITEHDLTTFLPNMASSRLFSKIGRGRYRFNGFGANPEWPAVVPSGHTTKVNEMKKVKRDQCCGLTKAAGSACQICDDAGIC